jgi:LVIVD repeat-containing protein
MRIVSSAPKSIPSSTYRNSDLAFWGRYIYAGNYLGFRIIDASDPEQPQVITDFDCPGSQHDVSVWKGLMFLSIDSPRTGPGCDSESTGGAPGWEGLRIFDVSNPTAPRFVTGVPTDCGSHTHTLVPDDANPGRVLIYISSYPASALGPTPYGTECTRLRPDGSQGHSKISIVEVPLANPEDSEVIAEPYFELNDHHHEPGFRGCRDITVFLEMDRAASACMAEGQIWDISNPERPETLARIHNHNFDIWHSSTFSWDGEFVVFGDEAGGGTQPRCRQSDPDTVGAVWFYDLGALDNMDGMTEETPLGHYKMPRPQGEANCTMHNFNVIPTEKRHVLVSASYSGGTTVADFTNPSRPFEVGHYDPHGANTWSSYWYNGFIYTNDSGRGVDIMLLSDRVRSGAEKFPYMNPQTQVSLIR